MNTLFDHSATTVRYERAVTALAYERLRRSSEQQAEAIARHYTAHATLALTLLDLLESRKHSHDTTALDATIEICVAQIKRNHRHDFGIELEWPNTEINENHYEKQPTA